MPISSSLLSCFCNFLDELLINSQQESLIKKKEKKQCIKYNDESIKIISIISRELPHIPIRKYIYNLINYIEDNENVDNENVDSMLIQTLFILNRLLYRQIYLNPYNIHRLLLTCIMISSKIIQDRHYSNSVWAKFGGVTLKSINIMEKEILLLLDFKLFVSHQHMLNIVKSIK